MLAGSFPKLGLAWLAWLAPGAILLVGAGQAPKAVFRLGWFAGLGHYLAALHWLLQIPMPLHAMASWLSLSAYLALFTGSWCWVCWRCFPRRANLAGERAANRLVALTRWQSATWAVLCAVAWVAMEMGVARLLTGFPWTLLGVSQHKVMPLIQIASVTGVYGVSFIVAWASVALVGALVRARSTHRWRSVLNELALPGAVVLAVTLFGWHRLAKSEPVGATLKTALVQPSIPQPAIWKPSETTNRLNTLLDLSRRALAEQPDLLVWPEAAMPQVLARSRATQDIITELLRGHSTWMVFGGEDTGRKQNAAGEDEVHRFNTAFLVSPAGNLTARYHKRHLVVLGEYMPAARWLPFLRHLRETGAGLTPGWKPVSFQATHPPTTFSVLICFEDIFPHLAREHVSGETDFLLNLTNNGWFGAGAAQWQHAASALFRAIENGVPLVRCGNNGLTCWIDGRGRMHEVYFPGSSDVYQAGFKLAQIPLSPVDAPRSRTIYHRYGDWFGWSCIVVTGLALAASFRPRLHKKSAAGTATP